MVPLQQAMDAVSLLSLSIDSGDNKHMCACDDFDHQPGASWRRDQDTSSFQPWRSEMTAFVAGMLVNRLVIVQKIVASPRFGLELVW